MEQKTVAIINEHISNLLADKPLFTVSTKVSPERKKITIILDGDSLINIDDCTQLSRGLRNALEQDNFPVDDWEFTVMSPGADQPMALPRQFPKHVGRTLKVTTTDAQVLTGQLTEADSNQITLAVTTGKGKNKTTTNHTIAFNLIKEAKIQVAFA